MRITPDCIPCLMKRILFQTELVEGADKERIMADCLAKYSQELDWSRRSVDVATEVHRTCYTGLGCDDPYLDLKVRADEVASRFVGEAEAMVASSDDPLRTALGIAIAGNIMDFGSGIAIDSPEEFETMFRDLAEQPFAEDDTEFIRSLLGKDGTIVYVFDNCGESQLDRVLIRLLRSKGKRVVGVVRGEPILNDVTMRDAVRTGLDKDVDLMLTTGKYYVGLDWRDAPDELVAEVEKCDAILAKGMANFEALSDEPLPVPIVHLLRAKCIAISRAMGVEKGSNVVKARFPEVVSQ